MNENQTFYTGKLVEIIDNDEEDEIDVLIAQGADVSVRAGNGATPLIWAATRARISIIERLIRAGADVNGADDLGQTALMLAANVLICRALLDGGADVHALDNRGRSCIWHHMMQGDLSIVRLLIDSGVKVSWDDIAIAAYLRDDPLLLGLLLKGGGSVHDADPADGKTLLMWAVEGRNYQVARYLLRRGADARVADVSGRTVLDVAHEKLSGDSVGFHEKAILSLLERRFRQGK